MFVKSFNFLLMYSLVVTRLVVAILPNLFLIFGFTLLIGISAKTSFYYVSGIILSGIFFCCAFVCCYIAIDFFFGITAQRLFGIKCIDHRQVPEYLWLVPLFQDVKNKTKHETVRLYIATEEEKLEIKSFLSYSNSSIIISAGLIEKIETEAQNTEEVKEVIVALLVREVFAMRYSDSLSKLLLVFNHRIVDHLILIFRRSIGLVSAIAFIIPFVGKYVKEIFKFYYDFFYFLSRILNRGIHLIERTIKLTFDKIFERKADVVAASIVGGSKLALAMSLSYLHTNSNEIASKNPAEIKERVLKVMQMNLQSKIFSNRLIKREIVDNSTAIISCFVLITFIAMISHPWEVSEYFGGLIATIFSRLFEIATTTEMIFDMMQTIKHVAN